MRKSWEFVFEPNPLSGMARNSPGLRPSTIDEKPRTGCEGRGKSIPLNGGGTPAPAGGPGARVSAGRTARPTRVGSWEAEVAELGGLVATSPPTRGGIAGRRGERGESD